MITDNVLYGANYDYNDQAGITQVEVDRQKNIAELVKMRTEMFLYAKSKERKPEEYKDHWNDGCWAIGEFIRTNNPDDFIRDML